MSTVTHLTIAEYDRMIAAGAFEPREQNRLELIYGELREMTPIGSEHEVIVDYLNEWRFAQLPRRQSVGSCAELDWDSDSGQCAQNPIWRGSRRRDYRRGRSDGRGRLAGDRGFREHSAV